LNPSSQSSLLRRKASSATSEASVLLLSTADYHTSGNQACRWPLSCAGRITCITPLSRCPAESACSGPSTYHQVRRMHGPSPEMLKIIDEVCEEVGDANTHALFRRLPVWPSVSLGVAESPSLIFGLSCHKLLSTTGVDSGDLSLLWVVIVRHCLWRSDYRLEA